MTATLQMVTTPIAHEKAGGVACPKLAHLDILRCHTNSVAIRAKQTQRPSRHAGRVYEYTSYQGAEGCFV
jgi:hypothetical protein